MQFTHEPFFRGARAAASRDTERESGSRDDAPRSHRLVLQPEERGLALGRTAFLERGPRAEDRDAVAAVVAQALDGRDRGERLLVERARGEMQHERSAGRERARSERAYEIERASAPRRILELAIGRVEEHEVERRGLERRGRALDRLAHDLGARADAQRLDVALEAAERDAVALDERRARRAARERLEAERARARERVEHARARDAIGEHVEDGAARRP